MTISEPSDERDPADGPGTAPPPGRVFTHRDFWHGPDLDLDAYLERVGLAEAPPPTVAGLTALHRAHLAAIPFENLRLLLDRPVALDVPSLTDTMVRSHRGGYCYEQNLLLAAVLDRLGCAPTAFSARVLLGGDGRPRPATHALLRVVSDGAAWLMDVGFGGGGLLEPFPLVDGHQTSQGGWDLRLDRVAEVGDEEWLLRSFDGTEWRNLYSFTTAGALPQDYAICSHYLTTHPRSPFRHRLMVARTLGSTRYTLTNATLTVERVGADRRHASGAGPEREVRELPVGELGTVLREVFDIRLDQHERSVIEEKVRDFLNL
ncbi:arylamine N-acetyltransferase [Nocardiopsis sp. MG754419]|uniref:arylamine N-acetyltransferase family protein n=1 Tax=Nocardiopsis sp. MG754419 TaxID=2259865 RepID=UPI001BAE0A19|nr:arylamine N-acetyltransferase [Nocardiopsis sp. MG754419]MBR8740658.1 N-hydroxyarylamine O-acetyltransferase [Nocardiopsis sp. MG754419]